MASYEQYRERLSKNSEYTTLLFTAQHANKL